MNLTMNTRLQSVSALTLFLAVSSPALLPWLTQKPSQAEEQPLQPVPVTSFHQAPSAPPDTADQGLDWRARLSQQDFAQRTEAFHQATRQAAWDSYLRGQLEDWAAGQDELAWTCHLILDQLRGDPFASMGIPSHPGSLFQRFMGGAPFTGTGLDQMLGMSAPQGWGSPGFSLPNGQAIPMGKSQGYRLEVTPDGAKLHVETSGPEGTDSQTFEADSLEQLQETYPDLLGQDLGQGAGLERLFSSQLLPKVPMAPSPGAIPTDVLGVLVTEVDGGLLVSEVSPRTMARALGLQPGDTLTELLGRPTPTVAEVQAALGSWDSKQPLEAQWLDSSGSPRAGTWKPQADR